MSRHMRLLRNLGNFEFATVTVYSQASIAIIGIAKRVNHSILRIKDPRRKTQDADPRTPAIRDVHDRRKWR
jgi:hypothetical protein